ncbi:MAG: hypothetical protein D4S01_06395 [Dehalococcoidia bacterium]|nr:MAG: hypothetical protein D4S01_06395 [Dehalococcoidia bacterium]
MELRDYGTNLCLYVTDNEVVQRLTRWGGFLYSVPYYKNGVVIAQDLHFEYKVKKQLLKFLNDRQPVLL